MPYDESIDPHVDQLSDDELDSLRSDLRELIKARIDGINYAEGRRSQILTIAGAVGAVGVALLPLANLVAWEPGRIALLVAGILLLIVALASWTTYSWQTNYNYPFKEGAIQNWKWFYWGALDDASKFGPGATVRQTQAIRNMETAELTRQWSIFAAQAKLLASSKLAATQDLKQLYLLHVNERYKNLFLTKLRQVIIRGLALAIVGSLAAFVAALLLANPAPSRTTNINEKMPWMCAGTIAHRHQSDGNRHCRQIPPRIPSRRAEP